ncbi:ATP-binding protein [Marinicella sediminis]|uniref:histidine kinase n=1 Tax=Marinicella sediminis TaxID=1792834 RepID=A0ABV7JF78_9GAMM|nr:hybrid sensor histidine kinase/response regulator [Marinicella sediminis]
MKLPGQIVQQIHEHYQATGWVVITLDADNQVTSLNQTARDVLAVSQINDIKEVLPVLAAEPLDESFYLPFYHHQEHVYDVHFTLTNEHKYLIMVPVDVIHQQVQYKQQMAHDEELEKLRFKGLFQALETAHQELREANNAKSFFISALSHEMGNPLNAIKGYNDLLAEHAIELSEATRIINSNVDKLSTIIRQTLDYDNQQSSQQKQVFSPAKVVAELCRDFQLQAAQKNLQLINAIDHDIHIQCHQGKWVQILTNLISNAIKYTDQGIVKISSKVTSDEFHCEVQDSGCGISEAFRKQLFKPWSREHRSEAAGNGIGLVISNMLAEQLSAQLCLHHSDSSGSTFRLSMPLAVLVTAKKVLLLDDDEDCLLLFEHYLTELNHQVTAINGLPALRKLIQSNARFDVAISDLNLGNKQVTEVWDELSKMADKCLLMTANPTAQLINQLQQLGITEVLSKPLSRQDLVNSVA